jgi:hypothetical protein
MMRWIEHQAIRLLVSRGYWVLNQSAPTLVVSYGTGTFREEDDGGQLYTIYMPPGHSLWALNQTVLSREP